MRAYDQGSTYRVTVDAWDVFRFNENWPGSALSGPYSFLFDKGNGDLVDVSGNNTDTGECGALYQDAKAYGKRKLKL